MKYRFANTNDANTPWSLIENPDDDVDSAVLGAFKSLPEAKDYLNVYLELSEDNPNGEA